MTLLLDLQEKLRDTSAAIAQCEREMAEHDSPALAASLRSMLIRQQRLEEKFSKAAQQAGVDVCSYRLFANDESEPLPAVSVFSALDAFQGAFSVVYDAVMRGPKSRNSVTADARHASEFKFGYSFSGSVGIVLTFSNAQMLVESDLDETMSYVLDLARSTSADDVLAKSRVLGPAAVKAVHRWVSNHATAGLGLDVKWVRGAQVKSQLVLQIPQLRALSETLIQASEDAEDTVTLQGVLVGTETDSSHRFHFKTDREDIRGTYSRDAISERNPAMTPARYEATFKRTFKKLVVTDEVLSAQYQLVKLTPIGEATQTSAERPPRGFMFT